MSNLKWILRVICIVLIAVLALCVVFHLALFAKRALTGEPQPRVLGLTAAIVISGSMEPEISVNDYVLACAKKEYAVGDVIIYKGKKVGVTHRIEAIETAEDGTRMVIAKGDNNNTADEPFPYENIIGKVIFVIPSIGALQEFFSKPLGFLTLTLVVAGLLLLPDASRLLRKNRK